MTNFEKELTEFFKFNNQLTVLVIVYKVVQFCVIGGKEKFYSKQMKQLQYPDLVCEYELNKKAVPKVGGLFAYRSDILDDTEACIRQLSSVRFKCIATISKYQVNQRIVGLLKKRTKRSFSTFWKNIEKKENYNYGNGKISHWTTPDYTIICSSITPIELFTR